MKNDRRFATASDSFDIESLMAEIDGTSRQARTTRSRLPTPSNDMFRVVGGRVMPLPMAA